MQITITTTQGTFIVPANKQADLIYWLQQNAIRADQPVVYEQQRFGVPVTGRQLINEKGV